MGGAGASWLVRSTPERAVRVRALAGDIESCFIVKSLIKVLQHALFCLMFVTAVCVLFLLKLKWPKNKSFYIVLCSLARHSTLTVSLSTQVYKWVPANCWGKSNKLRGSDLRWIGLASRPGEVEILLAASCYKNRDNMSQSWLHGVPFFWYRTYL